MSICSVCYPISISPPCGKSTSLASIPIWEAVVREFLSLGHGDYFWDTTPVRSAGTKETLIQNFELLVTSHLVSTWGLRMGMTKQRNKKRKTDPCYTIWVLNQTVSAALTICQTFQWKLYNTESIDVLFLNFHLIFTYVPLPRASYYYCGSYFSLGI